MEENIKGHENQNESRQSASEGAHDRLLSAVSVLVDMYSKYKTDDIDEDVFLLEIKKVLRLKYGKLFSLTSCRNKSCNGFIGIEKWKTENKEELTFLKEILGDDLSVDLYDEEMRCYFDTID